MPNHKDVLRISSKSAFKVYQQPEKTIHPYDLFMQLIESGQLKIADKGRILNPFEGWVFMESIKLKTVNGIVKIVI